MICTQGWEALRGDALGWLLDPDRPNLLWRVLVDLIGRPPDSPAVRRARGAANAAEPVAGLLADLYPDGEWATDLPLWSTYGGPGWRLVAAVQWGADPGDPRLHAGSERLLESAPGEGGLVRPAGTGPDPRLTARVLEAMVGLGWSKHPRVQEWFAWFEATTGWEDDAVAAVALAAASSGGLRPALTARAADGLGRCLEGAHGLALGNLGHPNLLRTDVGEILASLAGAGVEWHREWRPALERLQRAQGVGGTWTRRSPIPKSLRVAASGPPSRWITFKGITALLTYAVAGELPRMFPAKPVEVTPSSSSWSRS